MKGKKEQRITVSLFLSFQTDDAKNNNISPSLNYDPREWKIVLSLFVESTSSISYNDYTRSPLQLNFHDTIDIIRGQNR